MCGIVTANLNIVVKPILAWMLVEQHKLNGKIYYITPFGSNKIPLGEQICAKGEYQTCDPPINKSLVTGRFHLFKYKHNATYAAESLNRYHGHFKHRLIVLEVMIPTYARLAFGYHHTTGILAIHQKTAFFPDAIKVTAAIYPQK